MQTLDAHDTRNIEQARELLADLDGKTYTAVPDMARDFGKLEVEARALLAVLDRVTGRQS